MSRSDYSKAAQSALDRYAVPPLSAGFTDRVVSAALMSGTTLPPAASRSARRRDRRGLWRRVGQGAIGVAAFGMMSAAAVASGLLGAVGIEVPVLSAMLAPVPVKDEPVARKSPVVRVAQKSVPPVRLPIVETPPPALAIDPAIPLWQQARLARRAANEARRNAFLDEHPGLREAIADGPEARRAFLALHPEVRTQVRARIAEERVRRAAMRAANIQRQRAQMGDPAAGPMLAPIDPAMRAAMAERRLARRAEWDALAPEERAARIEQFRARREARRAMRAARESEMPEPAEGLETLAR